MTELEAGLQATRGYVGKMDHENQSVERWANAAIAAVERLEGPPMPSQPSSTFWRKVSVRTNRMALVRVGPTGDISDLRFR